MSFQLAQVNMMLRTGPAESSEDRCMEKNISHALKWVQVVRSNCLSCFFFLLVFSLWFCHSSRCRCQNFLDGKQPGCALRTQTMQNHICLAYISTFLLI